MTLTCAERSVILCINVCIQTPIDRSSASEARMQNTTVSLLHSDPWLLTPGGLLFGRNDVFFRLFTPQERLYRAREGVAQKQQKQGQLRTTDEHGTEQYPPCQEGQGPHTPPMQAFETAVLEIAHHEQSQGISGEYDDQRVVRIDTPRQVFVETVDEEHGRRDDAGCRRDGKARKRVLLHPGRLDIKACQTQRTTNDKHKSRQPAERT